MDRSTSWLRWALFESNPQPPLRQSAARVRTGIT